MSFSIAEKIKIVLQETYDADSICVYHLEYKNEEQTAWRAEVEAYKDVEDGPYFFIFQSNGKSISCWVNEARQINNESEKRS